MTDIRMLPLYDPLGVTSILDNIFKGISTFLNISEIQASREFWKYILYVEQKQDSPNIYLHYNLGLSPLPTYIKDLIVETHINRNFNYEDLIASIDKPTADQKIELKNRYGGKKTYEIVRSEYYIQTYSVIKNMAIQRGGKLEAEVDAWLSENCVHAYDVIGQCVLFSDDDDAVVFIAKFR